ncbi:MAG: prephenate dehydratase [Cyclobacteriaceae bacterium]
MIDLTKLRKKIDDIDEDLLELFNRRMQIVKEIGTLKRDSSTVIYRPEREKEIVDRLCALNKGILSEKAIEAIYMELFAVSRNIELPERIAYLGPEGSFTHQAAESRYGAIGNYQPLSTIKGVIQAVETERVKYGVVPVENNQEGTVQETIDLLGTTEVTIVAEIVQPISFAFGSASDQLSDIKKIYSKDIAFRQCKQFLDDYFGDQVELIPVSSTSFASKKALEDKSSAAICSAIAARQYGLPILYENIEDSADNHTRFLILSRNFTNPPTGNDKTSVLITLSHTPGSLASFLQRFHQSGINLSKVESRPAKQGSGFDYVFYIDFDGHLEDKLVQDTIEPYKNQIRWLGSYLKIN